jgi:hypothetical protein
VGIKKGVTLETIANTSIAPTLARILGVPLPGTEGPVLDEILAR